MFKITNSRGFHVTFDNGYTVSVQFGPGNYCENRHAPHGADKECGIMGSDTAEVAVIDPNGDFVQLDEYDAVLGYVSPEGVAQLMFDVASGLINKITKAKYDFSKES